ncbi:gamma-glutamylcyclotransferase [Roseobacter sp. SK209-2-6]|uniref:gamma-glutamylcyclotransferase n=1 Tax=Roseobacter sp. SK209-2-6 TaxID=388739 RepID=UPI000567011F|nr:gamma-glutamylcyclotransferase [Roseobacter sp. SK209-2-6]
MTESGFWVFGYGSLIWRPDFIFSEKHTARIDGYFRSFCMWSVRYRGTKQCPGLVLALEKQRGTQCHGVVYFVEAKNASKAIGDLRQRELTSDAYQELLCPVILDSGEKVDAICYVIDPSHEEYCGALTLEAQAQIIAHASGSRGPNSEYLFNTCKSIERLEIFDENLEILQKRVSELQNAMVAIN